MMKLAFVLFKYFPFGGLQRDMVRIAQVCQRNGHEIHVFTLGWEGGKPEGFQIHTVAASGLTNHARYKQFCEALPSLFKQVDIDRVVGFNKMPGLDYYYAADPCLKEKLVQERGWMTRMLPRYRHFLAYEKAVFERDSKTEILMIAPRQEDIYRKYYQTPASRMHMLPPGISRDRMASEDAAEIRAAFRAEFGLREDERLILCIGSGFRTKGLDRSLRALASLPDELAAITRLIAIGTDNGKPFENLARRLGVAERFEVLSGRDDVPRFLQGGDLLLHPAYYENSGMVILEAVVAGLPVLTTANCGYAFHVELAGAGQVIQTPFDQKKLNAMLLDMLTSSDRERWSQNGISYGRQADLYSMPRVACKIILPDGSCQ